MKYEEAINFLKSKEVTAYEIHKHSGYSQSGLLKILEGKVSSPRRKTKQIIIDYAMLLQNQSTSSKKEFSYNNKEEGEIFYEKGGVKFTLDEAINLIVLNKDNAMKRKDFNQIVSIRALSLLKESREGDKFSFEKLLDMIEL